MKKHELEKRVVELEKRVKELERPPWRYVPPEIMEPFRYPDPCCLYLDKCTACPHRWRIIWGDNTTGDWSSDGVQWTYTVSNLPNEGVAA